MNPAQRAPVGVILAGGRGRRLGGAKALATLDGRPLILAPLAAMRAALADVVVVAKRDTELPSLPQTPVWTEPDEPSHPLVGIVHALDCAGGRSVLVCAADLPFVTPATLRALALAPAGGASAVLASVDGAVQPLLGRYEPECAARLAPAASEGRLAMRTVVAELGARPLEVCAEELFNVNTSTDLRTAQARLRGEGGGSALSRR